jgi:hypothetical protein
MVVVTGVFNAVQLKPSADWKNAIWYVVALATVYMARSHPIWPFVKETALLLVAVADVFVPSAETLNDIAPDEVSDTL